MIKKILLLLCTAFVLCAQAQVKEYVTDEEFTKKAIPVVDIRTASEWRDSGILKDSIPITFFDEQRNYNIEDFVKKLNEKVDTTKEFALICRSGRRSGLVAKMLSKEYDYSVINLKGGMIHVNRIGLETEAYK